MFNFFAPKNKPFQLLRFEKIGVPPRTSLLKNEWTSARALEKKLQRLTRRGSALLTPATLQNADGAPAVLPVFFGGYRSFYTIVFPLLQKYNVPATVLLAPDLVGSYNAWQNPQQEPWQDLLTRADLDALKQSPLISFGALPLGGQNITACPKEQAVFSLQESIYRTEHQLGLRVQAWSCYPAQQLPDGFPADFSAAPGQPPLLFLR